MDNENDNLKGSSAPPPSGLATATNSVSNQVNKTAMPSQSQSGINKKNTTSSLLKKVDDTVNNDLSSSGGASQFANTGIRPRQNSDSSFDASDLKKSSTKNPPSNNNSLNPKTSTSTPSNSSISNARSVNSENTSSSPFSHPSNTSDAKSSVSSSSAVNKPVTNNSTSKVQSATINKGSLNSSIANKTSVPSASSSVSTVSGNPKFFGNNQPLKSNMASTGLASSGINQQKTLPGVNDNFQKQASNVSTNPNSVTNGVANPVRSNMSPKGNLNPTPSSFDNKKPLSSQLEGSKTNNSGLNTNSKEEKSSSKLFVVIAAILFLLIIVGAGIFFYLLNKQKEEDGLSEVDPVKEKTYSELTQSTENVEEIEYEVPEEVGDDNVTSNSGVVFEDENTDITVAELNEDGVVVEEFTEENIAEELALGGVVSGILALGDYSGLGSLYIILVSEDGKTLISSVVSEEQLIPEKKVYTYRLKNIPDGKYRMRVTWDIAEPFCLGINKDNAYCSGYIGDYTGQYDGFLTITDGQSVETIDINVDQKIGG